MFEKYLTRTGRLSCKQPQEIKTQWYICKFQEVHGDLYDYSKVVYTTTREKIQIICKVHGAFYQSPNSHLGGAGCPKCQGNKQKDTRQCVKDFEYVHGSTYDYSRVEYVNAAGTVVEIICRKHGSFFQRPHHHLSGKGCPFCQGHNQDTLYILKCLDTGLIKIGITNNLNRRISSIGGNLEHLYHVIIDNPREHEKLLHSNYQNYNRFNPNVRNGGTEFFQLSQEQVQEVIHYLESVQQGEF